VADQRADPEPGTAMPKPLPNTIRVLVKGASTVGWLGEMGGPRTDFGFPRAMEEALLRDGRPAEVRTFSVPSERTKTAVRRWEREFIGYSPDVVVLVYGHYETIHLFLPWWLERHANSRTVPPRRWSTLYRTRILRPVWMFFARMQARADKKFDPTIRRSRPAKVVADLEKLVAHTQEIGSPLVYLFELPPPATRYRSWFPGMTARVGVMNQAIEGLVDRLGLSNVRYFRIGELLEEHTGGDLDVALPDGFHFSPSLHRRIGEELARDVAEWADTQEHLRPAGTGRVRPHSVQTSERAG
jgi:lysophospholipase L1-like esterase